MKINTVVGVILVLSALTAGAQTLTKQEIELRYGPGLEEIFVVQAKIRGVHPFLEQLYPVAILDAGHFYAFEPDPEKKRFALAADAPSPMEISGKLRAAMGLEFYGGKIVCAVTGDVFDSLAGYVDIFHEFIHCRQWEEGEQRLKEELSVARAAMAKQDFMWELNHPFPYRDPQFTEIYSLFLEALDDQKPQIAWNCRRFLREILNTQDFEYMTWVEWKEGFARLIENRVKVRLGLGENRNGREEPFSRVSFYAGGEGLIRLLVQEDPDLLEDLPALFHAMRQIY